MRKIFIYSLFIMVGLTSLAQTNACIRRFFCCCKKETSPSPPPFHRTQKISSQLNVNQLHARSTSFQIYSASSKSITIEKKEIIELSKFLRKLKELKPDLLEKLIDKCNNLDVTFLESEIDILQFGSIVDEYGEIIDESTRQFILICAPKTSKNLQKTETKLLDIRPLHRMQDSGLLTPVILDIISQEDE